MPVMKHISRMTLEMAIGSGQLTGKGLNNNTTTSVKNGNYISEPQTDFIFAIIGEELGFVGCCIIIALLLLVVIQCILIGMRCAGYSLERSYVVALEVR